MTNSSLPDKLQQFQGCILGLAIGDALGGKFEGQTAASIRARIPDLDQLMNYPTRSLWYTDDTQMMIGVAETLIDHQQIIESALVKAFVANYVPSRGYGRGARAILEAMEEGRDYHYVANHIFPGGSYGNGAAMRVAPIGLLFQDQADTLLEEATKSAQPTHTHAWGQEGANILAAAIGYIAQQQEFHLEALVNHLAPTCRSDIFKKKLDKLPQSIFKHSPGILGNGIEAQESVMTAIACFAHSPNSYEETIGQAIFLGGDTDTIAAMAGALSGTYLGIEAIPLHLLDKLEESPKGKNYLFELAEQLYQVYLSFSAR